MRRAISALAGLAAALLLAGPAVADTPVPMPPDGDTLNLGESNSVLCGAPYNSPFAFHIYYNSGEGGSYRNIGYSVYDFDALRPGDGHVHPLLFCGGGAAGSAQHIKNNAASADNTHNKWTARVYYNSGYKGNQDAIGPQQNDDRFRNVYNENASFQWTS
ncbi:hypothetical protein ABZX93_11845 [Streptomyces sp. NPDC006632]|uniref:hypothetical protein n=1 Tax=unclassified Streptomyces TaxID=2593676 RepID=UPI002E1C9A4A